MIVCSKIDLISFPELSNDNRVLISNLRSGINLPSNHKNLHSENSKTAAIVYLSSCTEVGLISIKEFAHTCLIQNKLEFKSQVPKFPIGNFIKTIKKTQDLIKQSAKSDVGVCCRSYEEALENDRNFGKYTHKYTIAKDDEKNDVIPEILGPCNISDFINEAQEIKSLSLNLEKTLSSKTPSSIWYA